MFGITAFAESPFSSLGGDLASVNVSLSSLAITSSVSSISLVGDAKINLTGQAATFSLSSVEISPTTNVLITGAITDCQSVIEA